MSSTPQLDNLLRSSTAARGEMIMKAFTGLVVFLNAYFTAAFGYMSAAILRTDIWWVDGAAGALYYLALLDGAAIAWHYGQLSGKSNKQRAIASWMKRISAGASVLMSLAYVTLYTSLWDASGLVLYAQIMGAIIIYTMTAAQFIAYIMYRDSDPEHVEADAHASMRAEATNHRLESQATAMTLALNEAGEIMNQYTQALAQQQAHAIVGDLLQLMQYKESGARDLPQLPPSTAESFAPAPAPSTAESFAPAPAPSTAESPAPASASASAAAVPLAMNGATVTANFTHRGDGANGR